MHKEGRNRMDDTEEDLKKWGRWCFSVGVIIIVVFLVVGCWSGWFSFISWPLIFITLALILVLLFMSRYLAFIRDYISYLLGLFWGGFLLFLGRDKKNANSDTKEEEDCKEYICKLIWEILARLGRVVNICLAYVVNKHLSILFGAMLAVVVCVAASMKIQKLHDCIKSDMPANALLKKASKTDPYKSEEESEVKIKFSYRMVWAVDRMFSYDKARKDMSRWNRDKSGEKWIAVIAFGLFLFTWFVGGGVLVSALIATTIDIWSGKWRVWGILLRNHTVILGWDETVPVLLKEHIQSRKCLRWRFCRPETIVIMTEYPAHKVRVALRDVLHESIKKKLLRRPFAMVSTVVCNGKFDDADEIRDLCLQRANSIYVVGEMDDPSHDVRVLMTPKKIQEYSDSLLQREYFQFDKRRLNCHLNIKSLHLFWQHIHGRAKLGDNHVCLRPLNIVPHNFHDSWVKRLFSKVPDGKKHDNETHFAFRTGCSGDVHIVIVGFGAFGQALAVEVAAVAHYGKGRRTYITVIDDDIGEIDDDIGEKEREFRALFPRIDEIVDVHLSFVTDVKIGSEKFRCMLEDFAENARKKEDGEDNSQQLTVALTMERDEDNLKMVLPVYKAINGDAGNVQLIVAQKSCETDLNSSEETFNGMYGCKNVRFFGFRNGAGFDVWRREKIARELAKKIAKKNGRRSARDLNEYWWDLKEREKQYYRMMIDGLEVFCYVENLRLEDIVNDSEKFCKNNEAFEAFKKIDSAARKMLDIDEELIKEDEISSKLFLGIRKSEFIKIKKEECA